MNRREFVAVLLAAPLAALPSKRCGCWRRGGHLTLCHRHAKEIGIWLAAAMKRSEFWSPADPEIVQIMHGSWKQFDEA